MGRTWAGRNVVRDGVRGALRLPTDRPYDDEREVVVCEWLVLACCLLGVSDAVFRVLPAFVALVVFDGDEVEVGWLAVFTTCVWPAVDCCWPWLNVEGCPYVLGRSKIPLLAVFVALPATDEGLDGRSVIALELGAPD
jgi:hypothetical protein